MYAEEDLLMLSGVQHFSYCPRQWALIHIEQLWESNKLTLEGDYLHERADNPECIVTVRDVITLRSLPIVSYNFGIRGITDAIDFIQTEDLANAIFLPKYNGKYLPVPIEYKHGQPKLDSTDMVQVCAQILCLEEMYGIHLEKGAIYYGETRHRENISIKDSLRSETIHIITEMHDMYKRGITPTQFYSHKCKNCSLLELCIPKIKEQYSSVKNYLKLLNDAQVT